jgi:hypothetical protein
MSAHEWPAEVVAGVARAINTVDNEALQRTNFEYIAATYDEQARAALDYIASNPAARAAVLAAAPGGVDRDAVAEVLAAHAWTANDEAVCLCGWAIEGWTERLGDWSDPEDYEWLDKVVSSAHARHVADALDAAGVLAPEVAQVDRHDVERACEVMHDAYEAAASREGWETQEASRKPWSDVPEANKATMRAAVRALLDALAPAAQPDTGGDRFTALVDDLRTLARGWRRQAEQNSTAEQDAHALRRRARSLEAVLARHTASPHDGNTGQEAQP